MPGHLCGMPRCYASAKTLSSSFVRYLRDCEGATAVEFALVSVPFLGLLFAIFETAFVFFTAQSVEAATAEAARKIMTGQAQGNTAVTTAQQFKSTYLCPTTGRILPSYVDCNTVIVDVRKATAWTSANLSTTFFTESTHQYCTGNTSDVVVLRVGYPMPVYLSVLAMNGMAIGHVTTVTAGQTNVSGTMKHLIVATSVFKNEPFPGVTPVAGCP
jgi:Flp pilus assembly protein TadG